MKIIDLQGQRRTFTQPIVCNPNDKTVIQNGEIHFRGAGKGIVFEPRKPSAPVRVSFLSIRDVHIHNPDGPCLELIGCGKETHLSAVYVTGVGGAHIKDWDGGKIDNLYAFDCHEYGVKIDRIHAADMHITARQTKNGPGIVADRVKGCTGLIYSESNDNLGLELSNSVEFDCMLHLENNNRNVSGERNWKSNGHRFKQAHFQNCRGLDFGGFWGSYSGQWTADESTAAESFKGRLSEAMPINRIEPPDWRQFWPNSRFRPTFNPVHNSVKFPRGCFLHENQNRRKSQRWFPLGKSLEFNKDRILESAVHINVPDEITDELLSIHDAGKENALGALGFGGFNYNATFSDKAYAICHPWMGDLYPAAISRTIVRENSKAYPNYQPASGLASWDNPPFTANYIFRFRAF